MLLHFSFENFRSFREEQLFSMVAIEDLRDHDDRLIVVGKPKIEVLPVTAVFGGNAFGKSSFVEALQFVKNMILHPAKPETQIAINPFFLDPKAKALPTSFELSMLSKESEYEIFIKLTSSEVIEEEISTIKNGSKRKIYHRGIKNYANKSLDPDGKIKTVMEAAEKNALLISDPLLQKMPQLNPVYKWFSETLQIVSPDANLMFCHDSENLFKKVGKALNFLDTGIETVQETEISETEASSLKEKIAEIGMRAKPWEVACYKTTANDTFTIRNKNGKTVAHSVKIVKEDHRSKKLKLRTGAESRGTQRLLGILLGYMHLDKPEQEKVIVIDDLDRSLHVGISHALVKYHLNSVDEKHRSQLIFTTHDVWLIDDRVLRDDEIWIIDKNHSGISSMTRLSDFEENKTGMTFQQLYRAGNLGGSPQVFLISQDQLSVIVSDSSC